MKQRIFIGDEDVVQVAQYDDIKKLNDFHFVGFIPKDDTFRYMIPLGGSCRGFAIHPEGTWSNYPWEEGTYYRFDSAEELYEWLLGKD